VVVSVRTAASAVIGFSWQALSINTRARTEVARFNVVFFIEFKVKVIFE
jgi:hypothetical protein